MPPTTDETPNETTQPVVDPRDRRRARMESLVALAAALLAALLGVAGQWKTTELSVWEHHRHYLIGLAQAAAQQVDPTQLERLRSGTPLADGDHRNAVEPLQRLLRSLLDVQEVYVVTRDGNDVRVLLHVATPDSAGRHQATQAGQLDRAVDPSLAKALGNGEVVGQTSAFEAPYATGRTRVIAGWAPIFDSRGRQIGAAGVRLDIAAYLSHLHEARRWALYGLAPLVVLACGLCALFYPIRLRGLAARRRLQAERSRIERSERVFRSLFELSPVGIALNDLETGRFLQVNDALLEPIGYDRNEILGLSWWDTTPPPPEGIAAREALLRTGRYGPYESAYLRKDGSRYPVLMAGVRMAGMSGREVVWSIVQDISERKAMESKLTVAARCDLLTGLANRALFMERLGGAIERVRSGIQPSFAVLFLDFDRFKLVNDTLGHEAGDELLRQVAGRLRGSLRATDAMGDDDRGNLISRFGGDEFVILFNDLSTESDAVAIAERLLKALEFAYDIGGREVHTTVSIGIVASSQGRNGPEAVVRDADAAMYEAKRSGRGCLAVFNEAMHTRLARAMTIENALRRALGSTQLSLVYQPIVELDTGRVTSVEALVRWQHPDLGAISPSEFIPIAEESGLIERLGAWTLEESCRQLAAWRRLDPAAAPKIVSVNVSRAELALGAKLLERVRGVLERTGLPAQCLQLEVTEREVMRDAVASRELMQQLRALGVRLAMDDFGTGTSSLGCLRDYPFDTIKIDRAFVKDLAAGRDVLAVIHATLMLVENLGMSSVAEGVEQASQVAILQSLGCRYGQGYFLGRPVAAERLLGIARERMAEEPAE